MSLLVEYSKQTCVSVCERERQRDIAPSHKKRNKKGLIVEEISTSCILLCQEGVRLHKLRSIMQYLPGVGNI